MDKRRILKRIAWAFLAVLVLGSVGLLVWFKVNEKKIIYSSTSSVALTKDSTRPRFQEVEIESSEGVKLSCLLFPARSEDSSSTWVLYFHGNGGDALGSGNTIRYKIFHQLGVGILAVDYRGYGKSTGEPSETGLFADAEASYNFLKAVKGVPPEKIVIYGHSLGTAVATNLAVMVPAAGLVLEGAFTSSPALFHDAIPYLPWSLILNEQFESDKKINKILIPKLFIVGVDDAVSVSHRHTLFETAVEPKTIVELKGGHKNAPAVDEAKYTSTLAGFFQKVFHK